MDEIYQTNDIAARYEALKAPSKPQGPTMEDREQGLSKEINTDGTIAQYLVDMQRQELNLQSLIASGRTAEARQLYDEMNSTIQENRDAISGVAAMRGGGKNAEILVNAANRALGGGFNDLDVKTVDGQQYKLGQFFSDDRLWKNPGQSFKNHGYSRRTVDAFLNSEDEDLRTSLGFFMKDATHTVASRAGVDFDPSRIQNNEAADAVFDNWADIRETFGDGATRFAQYVHETHRESGAAAPMVKALLSLGKVHGANTGLTGSRLLTDVMGSYRDLMFTSFQGDPDPEGNRRRPVTPNKRLMADATIVKLITKIEEAGGSRFAADLGDDRVKAAFRECMGAVASMSAAGVDPFRTNSPSNVFKGFADHIAGSIDGTSATGGLVNNWFALERSLAEQVTGGTDFRSTFAEVTGDVSDYLRTERAAGGRSSNPSADAMAAELQMVVKKALGPRMTGGAQAGDAWAEIAGDPAAAQKVMDDLTSAVAKGLTGRGAGLAAQQIASEFMASFAQNRRFCVEDVMQQYATNDRFKTESPIAHESIANWFFGHTVAATRYASEFAQLRAHLASGALGDLSERDVMGVMSREMSRTAELVRLAENGNASIDPISHVKALLDMGLTYPREPGKDGKPDPEGKITPTLMRSGYRDYASSYAYDIAATRAAYRRQQELDKLYEATLERKNAAKAAEAEGQEGVQPK